MKKPVISISKVIDSSTTNIYLLTTFMIEKNVKFNLGSNENVMSTDSLN